MDRIVVGASNSIASRGALRWAADRAVAHAVPLRVVTAIPMAAAVGAPPGVGILADRRAVLESVSAEQASWIDVELPSWRRPHIRSTQEFGDLFSVLDGLVVASDLVVLGHDPRSRPSATTQRCLRRLRCPVVLICDGHPR